MKISVSASSGVEAVVKRELSRLVGKEDLAAINGRITFDGSEEDIAKCNLYLRSANRVGIILGEFKAENFDDIFDGVKSVDFENYLSRRAKIDVTAKCVQSKIYAISATQSVAKKAICERLKERGYGDLKEDGERYRIEISVHKDYATVTLDTSGEGLHRRGYRGLVGEAPLKETLAAAMIELSVWKSERTLCDAFCGSGTIPIEACMIAKNIPAGINRKFDFEEWNPRYKSIIERLRERAKDEIDYKKEVKICGFDIDEKQLSLARKHAAIAGVEKYIHFQRADVKDFSSSDRYGVMICNPPYGERLSERHEIEKIYRDYGKAFSALKDWSAYTLTPVTDFERLFGRKADKKRKLYNGKIECCYYAMLGAPPKKT